MDFSNRLFRLDLNCRHRKPNLQFSLKSLLIAMSILAVLVALCWPLAAFIAIVVSLVALLDAIVLFQWQRYGIDSIRSPTDPSQSCSKPYIRSFLFSDSHWLAVSICLHILVWHGILFQIWFQFSVFVDIGSGASSAQFWYHSEQSAPSIRTMCLWINIASLAYVVASIVLLVSALRRPARFELAAHATVFVILVLMQLALMGSPK
ncbi:MAG: hypothetical protein IH991_15810 [Planctomycetes bacterium]|nr:hypothetical protein [Planctomycetota bacterium]